MTQWVRNKSDEAAVDAGCYFDMQSADRVRYFFARFLRHSKGEWASKKFELFGWQWDKVVAPLFGWKMADGTRRFRKCGIAVAKKNGKSTLLSGISLYMLCGDNEPGAEVYSAAASKQQASIIYNEAANMVDSSPALATMIALRKHKKEMGYKTSWYEALSADVPTKDGLNIHCLLFDELHTQPNWQLWNTLRYGFAARRQPLLLWITTAGIYSPNSLALSEWRKAKSIQDGKSVDISFLPCIYEAEEADDWKAEETFAKVNPSYGAALNERDWQESVKEAIDSPVHENNFKRYRLNMWVRQETKWISYDKWDACKAECVPARRAEAYIGLDLATTTDLAAAVLLWKQNKKVFIKPYFWMPKGALTRRRQENREDISAWAGKFIKMTPGDVVDYGVIRHDLNKLADKFKVREIAIDPWNATQLATDLEGDGFEVVYVRTGFQSISAATKEFEKLVLAGELQHPGDPVLDWMAGNVTVESDASGNLKPSKKKSSEKIDGIVAAILAIARAICLPQVKTSRYERGPQT